MTTKAWLEGSEIDLDYLAHRLPTGDVRVIREDDRYYLTSPKIDDPPAGTNRHEVAQRLIARINGYGSLTHENFHPVNLSGIYDDEAGTTVVVGTAHLELRGALAGLVGSVTYADGTTPTPPPPPDQDRIALADSNSDVDEVYEILARVPLSWPDLYKIHEIVWRSLEDTTPVKLGWTTSNRDSAFTNSANNPAISGSDARHARPPKGDQSNRKMLIAEGRRYIRDLVTTWLDSLR